ncbi:MAG: DUF2934 domain-containing protein [Thiobacillus sp.]
MARRTSTSTPRTQPSETVRGRDLPDDERERMIREAAYYRYVRRGYSDGQDLDDWLAAEAALFAGEWELAVDKQSRDLPAADDEPEIQQQSARSPGKDDAVKRAIRKSPRRAIPQIEGIDPAQAPTRE